MTIKEHDFVEIEYTGRIKDTNQIFDLTDEKTAKENHLFNPNAEYGPRTICIGENFIIPGLDKRLIGKDVKEYEFEIPPEEAFGKKDLKLIKLVSTSIFKNQEIKPFPGLQINIDGMVGTIRTVSGGRTTIDFNHPLAGRTLLYKIKIKKIVTDTKEKLNSIINIFFKNQKFEFTEDTVTLHLDIPEKLQAPIGDKIRNLVPEIKKVIFEKQEKQEKTITEKSAKGSKKKTPNPKETSPNTQK